MSAAPPASPHGLGRIAFRASLVTGAAQLLRVVLQFAQVVILARLLTPADFGLIASVAPIIGFVVLFQGLGLQQAIVQRKDISAAEINRIFWVTVAVGVLITLVAMALAPAIAVFYGEPRMTGIAIAASAPILIGAIAAHSTALMTRRLQFSAIAIYESIATIVGFFGMVGAAYLGAGYWSLLIGPAAASVISLAALWIGANWTPSRPDFSIEAANLSFGMNLSAFNIVNFLARSLDNILIGRFLGVVALGYYDRAYKLLLFPLINVAWPLNRVVVPLLSRIEEDKPRLRAAYLRITGLLLLALVPGIAAVAVTSRETISLLLGERWLASAPIFSWLGLAGLVQPLLTTTGWLFIAQGHAGEQFRAGGMCSAITIAAFLAGLPFGAVGVAAAYALSFLISFPYLCWRLSCLGPVSFYDFIELQAPYLAAAAITYAILFLVPHGAGDVARVLAAIFVSYAISLVALGFTALGRGTLLELASFMRAGFAMMARRAAHRKV